MQADGLDALKLKDELQANLRDELAGLPPEEFRARIRKHLETSDDAVARKWREVAQAETKPRVE